MPIRLLFIVEGKEEELFVRLLEKACRYGKFIFTIQNAKGYGGIVNRFLSALAVAAYDFIFCVYDVDDGIADCHSPFNQVRRSLSLAAGSEEEVEKISLCTNPNILQLLLLCCRPLCEVSLSSTSKKTNTPLVHLCFPSIGKSHYYDANDWQLKAINDAFEYGIYHFEDILENGLALSTSYRNLPGSNWLPLIQLLIRGQDEELNRLYIRFTNHRR